jgi:hypothetical protein
LVDHQKFSWVPVHAGIGGARGPHKEQGVVKRSLRS